jgi:hypothetical protein
MSKHNLTGILLLSVWGMMANGQSIRIEYKCVVESTPDEKLTGGFLESCPEELLGRPGKLLLRMGKTVRLMESLEGKPNRVLEWNLEDKTWREVKEDLGEMMAQLREASRASSFSELFTMKFNELPELPERTISGMKAKGSALEIRTAFNLESAKLRESPGLAEMLKTMEPLTMRFEFYQAVGIPHPLAGKGIEDDQMMLAMEVMLRQFGVEEASINRLKAMGNGVALSTMIEMKMGMLRSMGMQGGDRPLRFRMEAVRVSTVPIPEPEFEIPADYFRIQ